VVPKNADQQCFRLLRVRTIGQRRSLASVDAIPFYIYYSMFGFQRVGDQIWAFADSRGKGFLLGGTAGRTTLSGEGLQHQDGHSLLLASTVPNLVSYDPAFAYEIAIIVRDGIRRMFENREDIFYYLTLYNENYAQEAMPAGADVEQGILRGIYRFKKAEVAKAKATVQLLGSGSILNEAIKAQQILGEKYGVAADVWSVTSYNELRREALKTERWNMLHPADPAKDSLRSAGAGRNGRPDRRGVRLHEGRAGSGFALAGRQDAGAGHRWLRTQRQSVLTCAVTSK
jgi:pyruvate dehydrogenase complex dehydrogenase (E1) component